MNKIEALKQAQVLEEELTILKKIIEAPSITPEQYFLQLIESVEIKRDSKEFPDSIFFFNGEKFLAKYDQNYPENLYISWDSWDIFETFFKMESDEVQEFVRKQVEKHFKVNVKKPVALQFYLEEFIESHFKNV